jgi:ABC-type branched-subunit amino acid transport system substrate-binding protein
MPVDQHPHIQFRTLPFSLIQRVQNAFATVILFEIQGDNANALLRAGYFFQQRLPEVGGSVKEIDIIN